MVSNEQALLVYALGDLSVYSFLLERFINLIRKCAGRAYQECLGLGLEYKDLEAVGMVGLKKAIETYNHGHIPFAAFAEVVITREIGGEVRKAKTPTNIRFYNALALDMAVSEDFDDLSLSDVVGEDDIYTSKTFMSEMLENIEDFISIPLDKHEQVVVKEKIKGHSFSDISLRHKFSRRTMNGLIEGIRKKTEIN
jgi:DNA-directed RNA polymerase specialized sigma24 family protein